MWPSSSLSPTRQSWPPRASAPRRSLTSGIPLKTTGAPLPPASRLTPCSSWRRRTAWRSPRPRPRSRAATTWRPLPAAGAAPRAASPSSAWIPPAPYRACRPTPTPIPTLSSATTARSSPTSATARATASTKAAPTIASSPMAATLTPAPSPIPPTLPATATAMWTSRAIRPSRRQPSCVLPPTCPARTRATPSVWRSRTS